MNTLKRPWPLGEMYVGFFRGPTIPTELVRLKIRDNRDVRPRKACGDFTADKDLPEYCQGCTQPKGAHSYESLAGAAIDFSSIEARVVAHMAQREVIETIPFKEPSPELMNTLRDIERAREDLCKMSGINDYFNCEKPT